MDEKRAASLELVILIGIQGAGKTSFYRDRFPATHVHVSRDLFRNSPRPSFRQQQLLEEAFAAGRSVVLDNTNPTPSVRTGPIASAKAFGARIVAYWFPPDLPASLRRNATRTGKARVPEVALFATAKRMVPPTPAEGFDALYEVRPSEGSGFEVRSLAVTRT